MNETLNKFSIQNEIQLRFLSSSDIAEIKILCSQWFPIDYPDTWFNDITSSPRFYSLAATYNSKIVGMIVAETKTKALCEQEDISILSSDHSDNTQVTYILSLGVSNEYRRLGIASILLDTLLSNLNSSTNCKAVYLHVLCTNETAIRFYEKRGFLKRIYLPRYYTIDNELKDGYCYVLYMNKGYPPWCLADCLENIWSKLKELNPCNLFLRLFSFHNFTIANYWFRNLVNNRNYTQAPPSKDFYRIS